MDFCFSVCVSPSTEKSSASGLRGTCTARVLFSYFLPASVYSQIFIDSESFSDYRTWNLTTNVLVILVGKEKKIKAILRSRVPWLLSSSEKSSRILTCSFQIQRDPCHVKLTAFCLAKKMFPENFFYAKNERCRKSAAILAEVRSMPGNRRLRIR